MKIFPFSHEMLMNLNIGLSTVHALFSITMFILVLSKVELPDFLLPLFLVVSIVVCILILLYSIQCKTIEI